MTATRPERAILNTALAVSGTAAMAVAWQHVAHWTQHVLHATPWVGYTNSAVSELVPIASLLVIRARRRAGQTIAWPVVTFAGFWTFSMAAQVAEAPRSPSGWLLSCLPALGAAAVIKLVLSLPAGHAQPDTAADTALVAVQQDTVIDLTTTPAITHTTHTGQDRRPVPAQRTPRPASNLAQRVADLYADHPDITQVQAADKLGCTTRTIRRIRKAQLEGAPA